jgi:hypothetical protein
VTIPRAVEIVGKSCFASCDSLVEIFFEPGSQLRIVEDSAFRGSAVRAFIVPRSVEILGFSSFCAFLDLSEQPPPTKPRFPFAPPEVKQTRNDDSWKCEMDPDLKAIQD